MCSTRKVNLRVSKKPVPGECIPIDKDFKSSLKKRWWTDNIAMPWIEEGNKEAPTLHLSLLFLATVCEVQSLWPDSI